MFKSAVLSLVAAATLSTAFTSSAHAQQSCDIGGQTLKMINSNGQYSALPNIPISVYRNTAFVISGSSDSKGEINLAIAPGAPVKVLFAGPNGFLPELQSLAAAPGMKHTVYVSLLTIPQAKALKIDPLKHVKAIIDQLKAQGVPEDDESLKSLNDLLSKLG